jgi:hypothetical protein
MDTRQIVDFAVSDNAKEMRDALYNSIHDRVSAHLDAAKQAVAQHMFAPEETEEDTTEVQPEENTGENT